MSFTKFTVEGDIVLGYHADEMSDRDRGVRIKEDGKDESSSLESIIARSLGFPDDDEFQAHSERMDSLRQQELQPADGTPDIVREGVRLRVSVEVIE